MKSNSVGESHKSITEAVMEVKSGKASVAEKPKDADKPKDKKNIEIDDCDNDGDESSDDEN